MTPAEIWEILIPVIATIVVSALTAFVTLRIGMRGNVIQEKRTDSQNMNEATDTARNALEIAREATEETKKLQTELVNLKESLSGIHRLIVDFEMSELIKNGKANVKSGTIEIVKMPASKVV